MGSRTPSVDDGDEFIRIINRGGLTPAFPRIDGEFEFIIINSGGNRWFVGSWVRGLLSGSCG